MADTLPRGPARSASAERSGAHELAERIEALSSPRAYPRHVGGVQVLQTHISVLFFTEERVYKLKKPVALEFIDSRAVEDRRRYCEEEVRLNRRLAPEVYLGVLPVTREADGRILVEGHGQVVDWLVEMVRLPADRMLDVVLEHGRIERAELERIAFVLAAFHGSAASGPDVNRHGLPSVVERAVRENLEQLQRLFTPANQLLGPAELAFVHAGMRRFIEENRELMERRLADVRIREGHGDLHAGNICLVGEDVLVYDCVEFDPALRCADVASDLAFLAMDLDHRGHPGAAGTLVRSYAQTSGDADVGELVDFYKVHRALVRAKVQLLTAMDAALDPEQRAAARVQARRYAQLALGYELPNALILTCGLPGTGKSSLARHVAGRLRAALLRSDEVRREDEPLEHGTAYAGTRAPAPHEGGRYATGARAEVYGRMVERALDELAREHSVVVDATFARRAFRRPFLEAAARLEVPVYVLHLEVPEDEARARIARRAQAGGDPSEADLAVYAAERERFEPPDELPSGRVLALSGMESPDESCQRLLERMVANATARARQDGAAGRPRA